MERCLTCTEDAAAFLVTACFQHHSAMLMETNYDVQTRCKFLHSPHSHPDLRGANRIWTKRQRRRCARDRRRSHRRCDSQCHDSFDQRGQRIRPDHIHRRNGPVRLLQCPLQPLRDQRIGQRLCSVEPEYRDSLRRWEPTSNWFSRFRRHPNGNGRSYGRPGRRPIPPFTPMWTATCSSRCRWRASLPLSAPWLRSPLPAWRLTPTASSTASATTLPIRFPSTANRSPTSRARSSPTSFPPTPFSPSRSSAARHRPSTAAKPAW